MWFVLAAVTSRRLRPHVEFPFINVPCGQRIPAVWLGFTQKPCILKTSYTAARPCGDCHGSLILLTVLMLVTLQKAPGEAGELAFLLLSWSPARSLCIGSLILVSMR